MGLRPSLLLLTALVTSGCFSMRNKPFEREVAADELKPIAELARLPVAGAAGEPASTRTSLRAPEFYQAPTPTVAIAPQPEIEAAALTAPDVRTEVKGAGDGSMKLDVVRITGDRPVEHKIPDYSPEQTQMMVCTAQKNGLNVANTRKAHEATLKAAEMLDKVGLKQATMADYNAAERARQDAVRNALFPVPFLNALLPTFKKSDLPKPQSKGLVIEDTDMFTYRAAGREVMAVSGLVRNTTTERKLAPPLTMRLLDHWEFHLAGQTSLLPFEWLEPGEAKPFELQFINPPSTADEAYVHFAPPFSYRMPRACDDAEPAGDAPDQRPFDYKPSELNALTQFIRREAELGWGCRTNATDRCGAARGRLSWRDQFVVADALDEAWETVRAANALRAGLGAGKATQAEVDAGERDRLASVTLIATLGKQALERAGAQAKDVKVALASSTYGRDKQGLFVQVAGTVTNTGQGQADIAALMLALVDRYELPLTTAVIDWPQTLAPGASLPFAERIALGREPPTDIKWQVRVGAMAGVSPQ